ncbi:ThiF family adenylyltransferase [Rhizobium sp. VS19-DR104.2]|uniref:HesA/MoeB/ThiF family protein n=1 Tax=unclassified Rhizobium TaxID=2613769 RepID=UPI001CC6A174|nr:MULTISPECIES: ThiF family adenylyltransferase [unclassified Rhizobium]MBZ5762244.1 ThiF family adenylyltransferase [Rhizobium sp. VS19-DR96]MBZ5768260.1 ThiF family adenylyltransferase [Rhizobium sp. VS19-DR129.2]MBZ5775868.1 ThiF family adenylyltransferase [Rhizobium sp. VS19-DRK62.2]MBZ5787111.1 ThiF family adenylyltransferase [Rhizobium sp. VS19-DR121]MBZ5804185.1 ThiF family adenylyltransferase [Rhizobium sp. VS19-DR181]
MTGEQHRKLYSHLFPGDGLEAAAVLLCRDAALRESKLMVVEVTLVPHDQCRRTPFLLVWPGQFIADAINRAEDAGLSIILLHSHPGSFRDFSDLDDQSDGEVIGSIFAGWGGNAVRAGHGSAVMMPDGEIIARLYDDQHHCRPIDVVNVVGEDIKFWWRTGEDGQAPMAFGAGMTHSLGQLHACIIGVSGTGSIVAEQLARMGFGKISLVDHDRVEAKNLNRILNSTREDASQNMLKVEMFAKAISTFREDIVVKTCPMTIARREAVLMAADADVIFCCVDSSEGRHIADRIAQAFMMPLFDVGVTIPTRALSDGSRAVAEVVGRVDYVRPGGSTLGDRAVYTGASLRAEYLARVAPETHAAELEAGYIKGAAEEAPSVIALNMRAASAVVLEFIARVFPFRHDGNATMARTVFMLADGDEDRFPEGDFDRSGILAVGVGAIEPLLGLPDLGA